MTALKPKDIPAALRKRPVGVHIALLFGLDQGLIRERAKQLSHQIVEDLNDPFNAIELTDTELSEVGRLADEAMALSFMGGERLIRVRQGSDAVTKSLKLFLDRIDKDGAEPNAFVVIEGGDLKKTSGLRKLAEASPHAIAIGCYADEERDVMETVRTRLAAEGLSIDDEALAVMASRLGEDRGITQAEIEKLILYKGPKSVRTGSDIAVHLDDVRAGLVDSAADTTFEVVEHMLDGDPRALSRALYQAQAAGVNVIALVRIAQGRFTRLYEAQSLIKAGDAPAAAIKKLRPPIFYSAQRAFMDQLKKWPLPRLEQALDVLFEADLASKTTGAPQQELVERTFLRLCAMAAQTR